MRAFERQEEESPKAYRAFAIYRDLGPERTLRAVAETLYGIRWKYGKRTVERWSSDFDWVARAQAFDDHNEMIRREAVEQYQRSQATDLAARMEALRELNFANEERAAALTARLLERTEQLLEELPLIKATTVREGEDGVPAIYQLEPATKNPVADAQKLHKIAIRSESTKLDIRHLDFESMTDEELERIANGEDPGRVLREVDRQYRESRDGDERA